MFARLRPSRRWWWLLLAVPLVLVVGFGAYVAIGTARNSPTDTAEAALQSDDAVRVETEPWLVFRPTAADPETGLILYPGGLVPPAGYAPIAHTIAADGYLVVIVPMPLNLAVTAPGRAAEVVDAYPDVQNWAIGGHSLGGAMAAKFAYDNPGVVEGLVLWASFPAGSNDLSQRDLAVLSLYGTRDGLATPDDIAASKSLLPPATDYVAIEGGNHTQFGNYGDGLQADDNPATISRAAQQQQIVTHTIRLLRQVATAP